VNVDEVIRAAIADRRLIGFDSDGCPRIGQPHESRSAPPSGWRWAVISRVSGLKILSERFAGPRPAPSGRHVQSDELFATVSPRKANHGHKAR
jgi:hypothetical protein